MYIFYSLCIHFINQYSKPYKRRLTIYFDLDGVMADYDKAKQGTTEEDRKQPGFFENLEPIDGAIEAFKKLILSHNKGLLLGDYLIDDRIANGVDGFKGEHIHFGTDQFPDWKSVLEYLL